MSSISTFPGSVTSHQVFAGVPIDLERLLGVEDVGAIVVRLRMEGSAPFKITHIDLCGSEA